MKRPDARKKLDAENFIAQLSHEHLTPCTAADTRLRSKRIGGPAAAEGWRVQLQLVICDWNSLEHLLDTPGYLYRANIAKKLRSLSVKWPTNKLKAKAKKAITPGYLYLSARAPFSIWLHYQRSEQETGDGVKPKPPITERQWLGCQEPRHEAHDVEYTG